jgi:uncharacterized membrane protein YqjE
MPVQNNGQTEENTQLINPGFVELEKLEKQRGLLGRLLGIGEGAKTNLAALLFLFVLVSLLLVVFFLDDSSNLKSSVVTALIATLASIVGYLFGKPAP